MVTVTVPGFCQTLAGIDEIRAGCGTVGLDTANLLESTNTSVAGRKCTRRRSRAEG
jgi:hypothetical protein